MHLDFLKYLFFTSALSESNSIDFKGCKSKENEIQENRGKEQL